jgi:Uma2 family endonuclease
MNEGGITMQRPEKTKYTYADYLTWNDGKRYELIDGEVYMMSPAPSINHQRISSGLSSQLYNFLKGKKCEVFPAPFDVRLNADTEDDTVVQPDISVICDPDKIKDGKTCQGAPDMVAEILSPATAHRDRIDKFKKYLEAGVREYWVIHPEQRNVLVYLLKDGQYVCQAYSDTDTISVSVLEGCRINMAEVFQPAPPEEEIKSPEKVR